MARANEQAPAEAGVNEEPAVQPDAPVVEEPAVPEKWVRVKNNQTGHEVTKLASAVQRAAKGLYTVLDKPAVGLNGKPLAPKPRRELGE